MNTRELVLAAVDYLAEEIDPAIQRVSALIAKKIPEAERVVREYKAAEAENRRRFDVWYSTANKFMADYGVKSVMDLPSEAQAKLKELEKSTKETGKLREEAWEEHERVAGEIEQIFKTSGIPEIRHWYLAPPFEDYNTGLLKIDFLREVSTPEGLARHVEEERLYKEVADLPVEIGPDVDVGDYIITRDEPAFCQVVGKTPKGSVKVKDLLSGEQFTIRASSWRRMKINLVPEDLADRLLRWYRKEKLT